MGSRSDWETMQHASAMLDTLGVQYEVTVVSAHRTPDLLFEYAESAVERGLQVIIAGAGGAAHLPGMAAAKTRVPVIGVPSASALSRTPQRRARYFTYHITPQNSGWHLRLEVRVYSPDENRFIPEHEHQL